MYKIMTRLNTRQENIWRIFMIPNSEGQLMDYMAETMEDAKNMASKILQFLGYEEVKIIDDKDFYVEVTADTEFMPVTEAEIKEVLNLLKENGYGYIEMSREADYHIEIIEGVRPPETMETFDIHMIVPETVIVRPEYMLDIVYEGSAYTVLDFGVAIPKFHLIIDGEEQLQGLPEWVKYEQLDNTGCVLTFTKVVANHTVELVID